MKKPKQRYNVYLRQTICDRYGLETDHEIFVASTYAVSNAQAETNVRYRNGEKYNQYVDEYQEIYYYAIPAAEDTPDKHEGFTLPLLAMG